MSENRLSQRIKSLSIADCWLLGLCVLPLLFWLRAVYAFSKVFLPNITQSVESGMQLDIYSFYSAIGLFLGACAVLISITVALKQKGGLAWFFLWLWALGVLSHCFAAINYMRLIATPQEGFRWTSEVHMVLRLLPFEVAESYWIGLLRLCLWLAIAVLFVRKCRRLKRADQRLQPVAV